MRYRPQVSFLSSSATFKVFLIALALCGSKAEAQEEFCVAPSDVYTQPVQALPVANLGLVSITEAIPSTGGSAPLEVVDCSFDGALDVAIHWSGETASQFASIRISPNACGGEPPKQVEVFLRHTASCTLRGLSESGSFVASANAGDHGFPQSLVLSSPSGIRTVEVIGAEICILKICIRCECDSQGGCASPGEIFSSPDGGMSEVNLGDVTIFEAVLPAGDPSPLYIDYCSEDDRIDVMIPWSDQGAKRHAALHLSEHICCGHAPQRVNLTLQHGSSLTLEAYDDTGALVDSTMVATGPPLKIATLSSPTGIRNIKFIGSEICLQEVCWECLAELPPMDPLWVDADNTTGIEDGSERNPFTTIAAAMTAAVTQTIQVRSGVYLENVELKNGVKLIGEGFETTIIQGVLPKGPVGIGAGVSCVGVGPETVIAGFTITGASVGVHCDSASPQIRENFITDIALGSLNGDGIRLDNSSPLIQNNVICHVGGMGIRGQGNSEPEIVNNSIYDYRYYAGISFAALDIGAVSPVIKNNIVHRGNAEPVGGILWRSPASPILSFNNVFDPENVTGGGSYYAENDGVSWVEISGGTGAISVDPLFFDPGICALQLDPLSPCIDAGDPAAEYNDADGSRNDMGAFGGNRLDVGSLGHSGSGFLFTSVGKIVVTEIDQAPTSPTLGLAIVSATAAADYHIPRYTDAPFGGHLWIRGLFGLTDNVDYYQIIATPEVGSGTFTLNDPLTKTKYEILPGGAVSATHIRLGPNPIGGVPDLYELNKGGYWSQQDLRIIWNTTGLNGRYRLDYKAYRRVGDASVEQVFLPPNAQDHLTLWLDSAGLSVQINHVLYADHTPIEECEDILFPHIGSSELIFNITANHPGGFLRYYNLDCHWGHNHYGGRFAYDQYVGSHDSPPPFWNGPLSLELPAGLPIDGMGNPIPWEDCAYRFRIEAGARTTDGFGYLKYGSYSVYHSVENLPLKESEERTAVPCVDCPPEEKVVQSSVGLEIAPIEPIAKPILTKAVARTRPKGVAPAEIWVDDDNTSGIEDGSPAHPYSTISQGIFAAAPGDAVRVLPGVYGGPVILSDGVSVIGSGADGTTVDGAGASWGVECFEIGAGTLFSGFRIVNAQVGIYCFDSDLSIRENVITGISPGTSADGIRLDDSSPLIQNNVIHNVDGMGVRAQGTCEPIILNNTIYDYRYYAGISFAAIGIGPASPLIKNNIVMRGNTSPVGGILWGSAVTPDLSYNDVFDPANVTGGGSYYAVHDGSVWTETSGGVGAINQAPNFIDPTLGYFQLDALSPCIDAGDPNPIYNDNDGSRNDMGAYGGQRLAPGASGHSGSGFIFTGIGKIPITEIVSDSVHPSHGLFRVSDPVANTLHIHKFIDAPLGGYAWLHGLFGTSDDVDYYQIVAAPYGTSATQTLDDPLTKTRFTINGDGTVTSTQVQMGPLSIGGVNNLYLLNKEGYWSFTDLRYIWNTTGLSGKYTVSYKGYRLLGDGSLVETPLPRNELDQFTILINNDPVQTEIESITYADLTPILECEKMVFPHNGDSSLIFTITAHHPSGFLRDYRLDCRWGNNRYGGLFTADQYEGSHDMPPPLWDGVLHHTLPPLLPRAGDGSVMDWQTCAYHFHLEGSARITDGVHYLKWSNDNVYQSVNAGTPPVTPSPTPSATQAATPSYTPTETSTPTPTPTATSGGFADFAYMIPFHPVATPFFIVTPLLNEDVSVAGIEVTQGIQCFNTGAGLAGCPDNSLPLVIRKNTTARIYLKYAHSIPSVLQRDNVPVRLYLRWNGGSWVSVLATGRARRTVDQSQSINSVNINFHVNSSLNSGTLDLYAEVDPNNAIGESNENNNRYPSSGFVSVDFFKRDSLKIVGRRLRYHPSGYPGDQYAGGWAVNGGGAIWLNQLLPMKNSGINYSNASGYLDWTSTLGTSTGQHNLISYLNTMWVLENFLTLFFTGDFTGADHVYGWAPDDGYSGGHADMPVYPHAGGLGVVAIGTDEPGTNTDLPGDGALIFGHELVHDYNVYHTNTADSCGSSDSASDFPYASSSIQEFGFNPTTGKVYNPALAHDLMSYCPASGSKEGWISPFTWNKMFNKLSAKSVGEKILAPHEIPEPGLFYKTSGGRSLVVNVHLRNPEYHDGAITGTLGDMHLVDAGATILLPSGEYAIELRASDAPLRRQDFFVSFESEHSAHEPAFPMMDASFGIPWEEGTDSVVLLHGEEVLDRRSLSANAPTVAITNPARAASWPSGTTQTLEWVGEDLDGDSLSYSVLFSRNSGRNWELLVTQHVDSSLAVAVDALAGGTDTRFRVVATDGLNIGVDETDAPISIPTKAPIAVITDPSDGARFLPGGLAIFQGFGTDLEDGSLPDSSLVWSSDLQGLLGTGQLLPVADLVPGLHVVTLTATDSEGLTGQAHVFLTVNSLESLGVDQNLDGAIDHADLIEILAHWEESIERGYPPTKADLNADGVVDRNDLFDFGRYYRTGE